MARLGDFVEQIRGVSYKPEDIYDRLGENCITLLRANNIRDGQLVFDDVIFVDKKRVHGNQLLKAGDILICTSSGSKELVGKAAYVKEDLPMTFGAFCKVVRPQKIRSDYLGHFFNSPNYRRKISDSSAGANINNIRNEHIDELEILLPTTDKQEYVAVVLNKLTHLISLRKQQLSKLDELVKARFVEMFGEPETNSKGWPIDNTGVITESLYIPEKRYAELQAQGQVPVKGDILVTSRGTLGQCYIVKADNRFYFQDGMISWLSEYGDNITPIYISYLFSMPGFRKQIDSMQAGSTVAYLSIAMIKKLKVMVPDLEIQQQFTAFVAQADKSKLTIRQSLNKLEVLKKSLMQEYFG